MTSPEPAPSPQPTTTNEATPGDSSTRHPLDFHNSGPATSAFAPPPPGAVPVPAFATMGSDPVGAPDQAKKPRMTRRAARTAETLASQDDQKVRHAALSVGAAVAIASGVVVILGGLILIVVVFSTAIPGPPVIQIDNGRIIGQARPRVGWLNADAIIWTVAILSLVSLVLTSVVGWLMARRSVKPLAEALRLQRHFVADASHELRTPLTALSSRVQILQRRLDNGKPIDDVVAQLHADTTNMARVLDDMLLTVEGTPVLDDTKTSVSSCLRQAVTSLGPLAEQSQITVNLQIAAEMTVAVPETSLTRAAVAVIDNAIQHSPAGSTVTVSGHPVGHMAMIRVTDQGSGITGVNPGTIFQRFAHGSETGRKRSFGLGLALTSEVAHRFGGDIQVESTSSQGTTFALSFPLI